MGQDDYERRFAVAKEIAEQIWREQQLTNSRMIWNLTLQGFLLTGFILTFTQSNQIANVIQLTVLRASLSLAGFFAALETRNSILASQEQRAHLRKIWTELYPQPDQFSYPRPFAETSHSALGRRAPQTISLILLVLWALFFNMGLVVLVERMAPF
ncbi:hypothetical protein [Rhodopseudomonas palustris]|nr:hypothetical protein [Rhodopseudomonas palustris]